MGFVWNNSTAKHSGNYCKKMTLFIMKAMCKGDCEHNAHGIGMYKVWV